MYTRGTDFFVSLYIHNITEASKVAISCTSGEWSPIREDKRIIREQLEEEPKLEAVKQRIFTREEESSDWTTADTLLSDD
jgi:hypothetical protein